jgi:hypothetical protein
MYSTPVLFLLSMLWNFIGVRGNETADGLIRNGSATGFVGPEPAMGGLEAGSQEQDWSLAGEPAPETMVGPW